AIFPSTPVHVLGRRAVKSPSRMRSSVASSTAESKLPFPFCLSEDPFSTTETGVSESGVEGRRALVFNLGLAKGFNCLKHAVGVDNTSRPGSPGRERSVSDPFGELSGGKPIQRCSLTDRFPRVHTSNSTSLDELGESLILEIDPSLGSQHHLLATGILSS